RRTLTPRGPRARRCPPRRRSPTPSAAAANANDPPAAGHRSPPPNATSSDWSAKDWPTTTSPQGFSSHRAPCNPTSLTSTPNSACHPACSSSKKPPATPERSSSLAWGPRMNTGTDRLGGDDGERRGQGEVLIERFDPGGADHGGQREGGFQHGEVVADT